MRKIFLTLVGSTMISLCALQAQQETDTTGTASESRTKQRRQYDQTRQQRDQSGQQRDHANQQQSDRNQQGYAYEGMVIIEKDQIPSSLKQTLQDEKYAGWEKATVYYNTNTGEYLIVPRPMSFDRQGKEKEMDDSMMGYGHRQGQQSQGQYSQGQQNQQGQSTQPGQQSQNQSGQYGDRTQESQTTAQERARNQMGEIPTSAPDQDQQTGQQQPSTGYRTDQNKQSDANQYGQSSQQYKTEDMVEIQPEQIPATLRRTLSETEYGGWEEKGKLYQNPTTNEYVLVMEESDNSSQPRAYHFDANGKLKEDQSNQNSSDQNKSDKKSNYNNKRSNKQ
jgi:hypothetical protein